MNHRAVAWLLGQIILLLAVFMLVPGLVGAWYREDEVFRGCLYSALVCALLGGGLAILFRGASVTKEGRIDYFRREGLAVVGLAWLASGVLGALPFLLSGTMSSFVDGFYEASSGFTTTGSSILTGAEIDRLPRGIVFWRSFTHWLGGIGIIIVFVLLFPAGGRSLFRSEVSGISREAARSRVRDSAFGLLRIYVSLTALQVGLMWLVHRDLFDCIIHAFGTLATGGFSSHGSSALFFGSWKVEIIITVFMFVAGVNFDVYDTFQRQGARAGWRALTRSTEVRAYTGIVVASSVVIGLGLWFWGGSNGRAGDSLPDYSHFALAIRDAFFTVTSVQTSTGFATNDFDRWPDACRFLLVLLMVVGACAGSTGGGIKVVRVVILLKAAIRSVGRFARPRAIHTVHYQGRPLDETTVGTVSAYFALWFTTAIASTFALLALGFHPPSAHAGQRILTAATSVIASLNNIGPGLTGVGPAESYAFLPDTAKLLLSFLMILGRLEFAALVALLLPRFWRA